MQTAFSAQKGSFFWLAAQTQSRFQGIFFKKNDTLLRVVESLGFLGAARGFDFSKGKASILLPDGIAKMQFINENAVSISLPTERVFELFLDCKEIFDQREWGRYYETRTEGSNYVIRFLKRNDPKEQQGKEWTITLKISGKPFRFEEKKTFVKRTYHYDKNRRSPPEDRWVYYAGDIIAQECILEIVNENEVPDEDRNIKNQDPWIAALLSMQRDSSHFAAGYPWFYDSWTRDELITSFGLIACGKEKIVKTICEKYLGILERQPYLQSKFPSSDLVSADGFGLLAAVIEQLLERGTYNANEAQKIAALLEKGIEYLWLARQREGLIFNNPLETWMDTKYEDDGRSGFCIEIQALTYAAFRCLEKITKKEDPRKQELQSTIRKHFVQGKQLLDKKDNQQTRPNLFIAYKVAPELFSQDEWKNFFDSTLEKLWLPWGGIASLDPKDPKFCPEHTGQDNKSYHRGDSWFWINHIAAVALARTDKEKYKKYISAIVDAAQAVQTKGAKGYLPEVSSAKELRAEGCIAQTWSIATFVELQKELNSQWKKSSSPKQR